MTGEDRHRQAIAIAAYLAQFDDTDPTAQAGTGVQPGYANLPDADREQRRQDLLRAARWAQAPHLTENDIRDLGHMRRRYGFP